MIIVMKQGVPQGDIDNVTKKLKHFGVTPQIFYGTEKIVIAAIGDTTVIDIQAFETLSNVETVTRVLKPFKLGSKEFKPEGTKIKINDLEIGGRQIVVMAGPCAVESQEQIRRIAQTVKQAGAKVLRGGAFKPRTSPYAFRGLAKKGLEYLAKAKAETELLIITEVTAPEDVKLVSQYANIFQIGARNMQNFSLLSKVGMTNKPVLLKRGIMSTIEELMLSAEYILKEGNFNVMLCERGIRTFETYTRNTLDLNAVAVLKNITHLPVIVDPSHGTGHWEYVNAMSKAAVAAGADGLLIEVHDQPEQAFSDGTQSLKPEKFAQLMQELAPFAQAAGRYI